MKSCKSEKNVMSLLSEARAPLRVIYGLLSDPEPQAAYSAYISGIQHRWKFVQRTVPNISEAMEPLEHEIRQKLLPKMLGREISD